MPRGRRVKSSRPKMNMEVLEIFVKPEPKNSILRTLSETSRKQFQKEKQRECVQRMREFAKTLLIRLPEDYKRELVFHFQVMERHNGGPKGRRKLINMLIKTIFEELLVVKRVEERLKGDDAGEAESGGAGEDT